MEDGERDVVAPKRDTEVDVLLRIEALLKRMIQASEIVSYDASGPSDMQLGTNWIELRYKGHRIGFGDLWNVGANDIYLSFNSKNGKRYWLESGDSLYIFDVGYRSLWLRSVTGSTTIKFFLGLVKHREN